MNRNEFEVAVTFAIMFVIGLIISGIYSAVSLGEDFFSRKVVAIALFMALVYLFFIWVETRRYKVLTLIGLYGILLLILLTTAEAEYVANVFTRWNWYYTATAIFFFVEVLLAEHQAKKLMKTAKNSAKNSFKKKRPS